MTLGRTSTGAIKIKSDSPNGLRAVECACCGGGGSCGCSPMSAAVKTAIASATQVTVNGSTRAWNGSSASSGQQGFGVLIWKISYAGGTLCFSGDDGDNTYGLLPEQLMPNNCAFTPFPAESTITIQGESYRSVLWFAPMWGPPPSISINFS